MLQIQKHKLSIISNFSSSFDLIDKSMQRVVKMDNEMNLYEVSVVSKARVELVYLESHSWGRYVFIFS